MINTRFHKNVPLEHREILTEQLKKYEKEMAMTSEERKELHKNPGNNPRESIRSNTNSIIQFKAGRSPNSATLFNQCH